MTINDLDIKLDRPVFEVIELITDQPVANSYYIEVIKENPLTINVTITSATKAMRMGSSLSVKGEYRFKDNRVLGKKEKVFLLNVAAMQALTSFYYSLLAIGAKIESREFLIELSEEEIEASLNNKTYLN